jgi:hypothetical protein
MNAAAPPFQSQAKLWLTAFVVSALLNALAVVAIGFWVIANLVLEPPAPVDSGFESVAFIVPQAAAAVAAESPEAAVAPPAAPSFARTSPDQAAETPERPDFIGERNTRATRDAPAVADAPEMPSQTGREPRFENEIETTESEYQDGDLAHDRVASPGTPPVPESLAASEAAETPPPLETKQGMPVEPTPAPPEERLAEGPVTVDRPVKESPETEDPPKPTPPEREPEGAAEMAKEGAEEKSPEELPKPASPERSPGFRGNQQKTRLEGSISRVGRSALNVEDSSLGRYHAAVSRAVEKEWQRNCVRNRDYITPGQLTMRVMLEASGKVRSVGFVEEFGVGNIPKGFTINSIRDAEIPAMPADLKKQLDGEPLELIYRFNF